MEKLPLLSTPETPLDVSENSAAIKAVQEFFATQLNTIYDPTAALPIGTAPRFLVSPKDATAVTGWVAKPIPSHGVVRSLAFDERVKSQQPYAHVLFSDGGRNGDPWGGLCLELNGNLYHFHAGVKKYPALSNSNGIKPEGIGALAAGVPGALHHNEIDWKWVQEEVDITPLIQDSTSLEKLEKLYAGYVANPETLPIFQSRIHADALGIPIGDKTNNCTTIVMKALDAAGVLSLKHCYPLNAVDALKDEVANTTPLACDWISAAHAGLLTLDLVAPGALKAALVEVYFNAYGADWLGKPEDHFKNLCKTSGTTTTSKYNKVTLLDVVSAATKI